MRTHLFELWKDMFKIPLQFVNMTTFSDHSWRFGKPKAFYITIDDTLIRNSNDLGGKILREAGLDFEEWKDYYWILEESHKRGYAHYYLRKCENDSKMKNEADATVFQKLVDIDSTLGTELSDQLYWCLWRTTRWDIIKVLKFLQIKDLKIIIGYRLW